MDRRKCQLLDILSERTYCKLEAIASQMKVGSKTVRNLIRETNQELEDHGAQILLKYGTGYLLEINDEAAFADFLRIDCAIKSDYYLPSTSEERVQYLLEYLFNSPGFVKLDDLSDTLYISRRALAADMKRVENHLEKFNIKIVRKPNYGIKIEGSEFDTRLCIASFSGKRLYKGNQSMDEIAVCVADVFRESNFSVRGAVFQNLVVHLYIAISRIMEGYSVPALYDQETHTCEKTIYAIAERILRRLENYFKIQFPESELSYIAVHLAGKELFRQDGESDTNMVISQEISDLVSSMLQQVYESFKFDFRDDLELRMILSQHLVPLSTRIRYRMDLKNPLLKDVKEKFCLAYTIACSAVTIINGYYNICLSEDETAYFAFAFAFALERKNTEIKKKNVLLVCASGRGSAQLLLYKYKRIFSSYIDKMVVCDIGNLYKVDFSEYDYIFTTVPISYKVPIPIQEVEYFLNDSDIDNVKRLLQIEPESVIRRYFSEEMFLTHLTHQSKETILRTMCEFVIEQKGLPAEFYESVLERERLAKTEFGNLAAMPHSYKAMSDETFVCIGILDKPVVWDEQNVQVVFLVSIADKDHTSKELQRFYQTLATFLLDSKKIMDLIKMQHYGIFIETMVQIESRIPDEL